MSLVPTREFFDLIRVHYRIKPESRANDIAGRLAAMANPVNRCFRITDLTRRCLQLFIARRTA